MSNRYRDLSKLGLLERTVSMDNSPSGHHYIVLSYLYEWMETIAVQHASGKLLDFGCGGQTYRNLFEGCVDQYIGADVVAAPGISLDIELKPNQAVDIEAGKIDTVLSNQVLEHVPDPNFYLSEVARVLKKNGTLVLTAPMQWRHHEVPFDYYRFTKYGVIDLLERNGFSVIRIDPCGGVFALIGQILCDYFSSNNISFFKWGYRAMNRFFLWLDSKYPDSDSTINWMCIAKKL